MSQRLHGCAGSNLLDGSQVQSWAPNEKVPKRKFRGFYYYDYDADNRLKQASSSRTDVAANLRIKEAYYSYYKHGPLARVELGKNNVQGIDYAYTLQGWLKGVNSNQLDVTKDMSADGQNGTPVTAVARDAFGFSIGYFNGDYAPVGGIAAPAFGMNYSMPANGIP